MTMFHTVYDFTLNTLFPISCLSCGQPDTWLCDDCLAQIPSKLEQVCPFCEKKITPGGQTCFSCQGKSALSGLLVASHYKNTVPTAVHFFKYRYIEGLQDPLGEILAKAYLDSDLPLPDVIIPVPLHKRRLRMRGFNQSELLARFLGANLTPGFEIPVLTDLLIRSRYTHPQMEIKDHSRRRKNIQDAFSINKKIALEKNYDSKKITNPKKLLQNKSILLVDDICTTGSTLFECAKVLKKSGAKEVFGIVIARQEYKKK